MGFGELDSSPELDVTISSKPAEERKSVRFNLEEIKIHIIFHAKTDLSEEELSKIWYQEQEYDLIKEEVNQTIKKMSKGLGDDHEDFGFCSRGLEHKTRAASQRRKLNNKRAMRSVFDEQDRQKEAGIHDGEALSDVYRQENCHCREGARLLGEYDEAQALVIRKQDEETEMDSSYSSTSSTGSRKSRRGNSRSFINGLLGRRSVQEDSNDTLRI